MYRYKSANSTNETNKIQIIYPDLSYKICGICFAVHNAMGWWGKERQYAIACQEELKKQGVEHRREVVIGDAANIADFIVEEKILLELKAKPLITKQDFYQVQRYLQTSG